MNTSRIVVASACALLTACAGGKLLVEGDIRELRAPELQSRSTRIGPHPKLLVIGIDGIDRALLYHLLRSGQLPELAALLGGREGTTLPHAHLDDTVLSPLPSNTLPAWASVFTGETPAEHGVPGNEFFLRGTRTFAAPAPTTFDSNDPVVETYTEDYCDDLLQAPTVYQRLRAREPEISIWVSLSQFHRGADRLLMPKQTVIENTYTAFLGDALSGRGTHDTYQDIDLLALRGIRAELELHPAPDVLTIYLPGSDLFTHVSEGNPLHVRSTYLREVLDPELGHLRRTLAEKNELQDRYVVLVSDHGHTQILADAEHAITTRTKDSPVSVLEGAGFELRPFRLEVSETRRFDAVLAYNGAMALVYVADRSQTEGPTDWTRPPRFEQDVLAAAEAFHQADATGLNAPSLQGALDLILTREPRPHGEVDLPFQVYLGRGRLQPIGEFLLENPRPSYVALEERLRELAVGPAGDHAGDVLLLAHFGDRDQPSQRRYFSSEYRSWHGSPSRQDSEVPFIVAHPGRTSRELEAIVRPLLGPTPRLGAVTDLLLRLRAESDDRAALR